MLRLPWRTPGYHLVLSASNRRSHRERRRGGPLPPRSTSRDLMSRILLMMHSIQRFTHLVSQSLSRPRQDMIGQLSRHITRGALERPGRLQRANPSLSTILGVCQPVGGPCATNTMKQRDEEDFEGTLEEISSDDGDISGLVVSNFYLENMRSLYFGDPRTLIRRLRHLKSGVARLKPSRNPKSSRRCRGHKAFNVRRSICQRPPLVGSRMLPWASKVVR